jgi:hypothetical protein
VKGHQDRRKQLQDIDDEGKLNIEVDRLATLAYTCPGVGRSFLSGPVFREEVYGVTIDGAKVTTKLKQRVIKRCGEEQLRQYMLNKHRLSDEKMEGVNWQALQQYLRKLSPLRRATQIKLQHNWIPTKGFLFVQRRESCDQCPLCKSAVETASHVRQCREQVACQYRRERLEVLLQSLQGINTAPEIIRCWRDNIRRQCGDACVRGDLGGVYLSRGEF